VASAATLRRGLVGQLQERGLLEDKRVRDAFLNVPREHFVPEVSLEEVYEDRAILAKRTGAGHGLSSSSQPGIMAEMLNQLELEPGQRVLEIGAGTGYNAALLESIVGPKGRVFTVDIDPEMASRARAALKTTRTKVVTGDGRDGYGPGSPYDRIIVTASHDSIPHAWLEQLHPGGLLEVPLRMRGSDSLQLIPTLRREGDRLRSVSIVVGGFMPIRAAADDLSPYWPALNVTRADGAEVRQLFSLYGQAVRSLSRVAARRLVATACSEPRIRRVSGRSSLDSFAVFLVVTAPTPHLVGAMDEHRFYAGLISRDGTSLAMLESWRSISRILVFGSDKAADELEALIDRWKELGRPGVSDVGMSVSFRNGHSTIRTRWRGR
jgi:protein-L-isoaspartate(D-aspartate) O-methyltransferase